MHVPLHPLISMWEHKQNEGLPWRELCLLSLMYLFQWHHGVVTLWINSPPVLQGNNRDKDVNTHTHTYIHSVSRARVNWTGRLCLACWMHPPEVTYKVYATQEPSTVTCLDAGQLPSTGLLSPFPGVCGDPWTERKCEHGSGEHDGSNNFVFSVVVVGGQEWMSLIDKSAISLALTLARCLSFVQNGAERRRVVHAGGNIGCMGTESWWWVCPQEHRTVTSESPFQLPVPKTTGLW